MSARTPTTIIIEDWELDVASGLLKKGSEQKHLEPKVVDVLVYLTDHAGELVTRDQFIQVIWQNRIVSDEVVTRCITELRHAFADTRLPRRYVETLPRRGYRLIAKAQACYADSGKGSLPGHHRGTAGSSPAESKILSIAVLPFDNLSPLPENAFFAAGMHHEVLATISKVSQLKVISRTSVLCYANAGRPLKQIATELDVSHVLEGTVRRAGDSVRITVQLADAENDQQLWAETYNRHLTAENMFDVQSEISLAIATVLKTTLTDSEQERVAAVLTRNFAAYEAYLLGRLRMARRDAKSLAAAVEFFKTAVKLDPDFALAYVFLADSYNLQIMYAGLAREDLLPKSRAALETALALDFASCEAQTSYGYLKTLDADPAGAEQAYQRALSIDPNYVTARHWYSAMLSDAGRLDEALEQIEAGLSLDPLSVHLHVVAAQILENLGQFRAAMAHVDKTIEIDPSFQNAFGVQGYINWYALGRLDEALDSVARGYQLDPLNPARPANLGQLLLDLGEVRQARKWIDQAIKVGPQSILASLASLHLCLYQGDHARAQSYAQELLSGARVRNIYQGLSIPYCYLQHCDLSAGNHQQVIARISQSYPQFMGEAAPVVNKYNLPFAVNTAFVLSRIDAKFEPDRLIDAISRSMARLNRLGTEGYWLADVQICALKGEFARALAALKEAVECGWRALWWYYLEQDPLLQMLHGNQEFNDLKAFVKADMKSQLSRVSKSDHLKAANQVRES